MARLTCRSCKAPLRKRGARCRNCGWASNYDMGNNRRERELLIGVGLMALGVSMALAIAFAVAYMQSL